MTLIRAWLLHLHGQLWATEENVLGCREELEGAYSLTSQGAGTT